MPEAGRKYFGLHRAGSYAAAARGDLPTIRIGRQLRVSVVALERMLEGARPTPRRVSMRLRDNGIADALVTHMKEKETSRCKNA